LDINVATDAPLDVNSSDLMDYNPNIPDPKGFMENGLEEMYELP
jgi:hypothetical protein